MIITIEDAESLIHILKNVVGVTEVKQTMPVLSNVLIRVDSAGMHFSATDLEVQVQNTYNPGRSEEQIETTLPAKKLLDIIQALSSNKKITLHIESEKTTISAGKSELVLPALPANDFPLMKPISENRDESEYSQMSGEALSQGLTETSFCMAYQDARHYLNGLYFEKGDGKTTFVSTDGHRLALTSINSTNSDNQTDSCIVPRKCINELKRILASFKDISKKIITFNYNNKQIEFNIEGHAVTSKLIEGKFPEYKKVFPEELPNKLTLNKAEFKQHLSVMSQVANEKYKGVKLTINNKELLLSSTNSEQNQGKGKTAIPCEYQGEPMEIGFNLSYLLETIDVIPTQSVLIQISNSDGGCLITASDNDSNNKYIIMPMRV